MKLIISAAVLATIAAVGVTVMTGRSNTPSEAAEAVEYTPPVPPTRTPGPPPAIPDPPPVPARADALPPLRFTVTTTRTDAQGQERAVQRVTRTSDRVHLLMEGTRKEWLFERNPIDRRRVSGYLIDHEARQVLAYQESDLRNEQQLRGWRDALLMRFDPESLRGLQPSTHRDSAPESMFGATFTRYVAGDPTRDGVVEVWWSDALLLPLRLTIRHRGVTTTARVDRLEAPGALEVLADPRTRFPEYASLDVTDSRERRH
jgi:hypothetical protein